MLKKRVLFVMPQLDAGGSERVVLDLLRGLDPRAYEFYVAAFKGGVLEAKIRQIAKNLFFIDKRPGIDIHAMYQLAKIIKRNKIDLVNAHHFMPFFYSFMGACILGNNKLIYTEHSCPEVEKIFKSFYRIIFSLMLYRVGAVIGVSSEVAKSFIKCYPSHHRKIFTVKNGIDIERFSKKKNRDDIRKKFGIDDNNFVIGCVANFRKVKNHIVLLSAASRLKTDFPELRVILVGTGFMNDNENSEGIIKNKIIELGLNNEVILAGYQENIPEILSAFDIFCLPSLSEGLPVSILEAMASKIAVVGSNVNGINEVIKDRETGVLFKSDNEKELAQAIRIFKENKILQDNIITNAFQFVMEKHDLKNWINNSARVFQYVFK